MKKALLMLMALGLFSAANLRADITYLNENFGELTSAVGVSSVGAFQTINDTNVDIIGGGLSMPWGYLCDFAGSPFSPTGKCIDMDGSAGDNPQGQLESTSEFAAGTYYLSFDLLGSQRYELSDPSQGLTTSTTVSFGNYNETYVLEYNGAELASNFFVTLDSPGYLLFSSNTPGNEGSLLGDVVVDGYESLPETGPTKEITPEPSSWYLLATGLLALMGLGQRKFGAAKI